MEAKDLRIGNYVNIEPLKEFQTITDVMCDSVNTYQVEGAHYGLIHPIPITEEWLLKFGFEESECINYKGKKEFIISPKNYVWELGFVIGNYPISNPNIGCLSLLQSKDEQISAIPKHLVKKNNWTEEDKIEADNHTITSKAWRQPIAYNVAYVHHLQNLYHSLTGQELCK